MNRKQLSLLLLLSLGAILEFFGVLIKDYGIVSFYQFFTTSPIHTILFFTGSVVLIISAVYIFTYFVYYFVSALIKEYS